MKTLTLVATLFCVATLTEAGVVTPDGVWQHLQNPGVTGEKLTGIVNNNSTAAAYWNNTTSDGANCSNVGCFITQQSYYTAAANTPGSKSPNLDSGIWLGKNTGAASLDFSFNGQTGNEPVEVLVEIAGYKNANWMGWYDTTYSGSYTLANRGTKWDLIFDGNDSPTYVGGANSVSSKLITPSQNFGFWFLTNHTSYEANATSYTSAAARLSAPDPKGAMFTQASKNKTYSTGTQYFSLFAESEAALGVDPTKFWVGVEDLKEGDFDYNDMIFNFSLISAVPDTFSNVPEPGFYGALALGLGALYVAISRRSSGK